MYGSLFFDKVAACEPATLSKKEIRSYPVNFAKFLKKTFFIEPLQTAASVRLEAFLVSSKIVYFPFSSKLKLDFFELF